MNTLGICITVLVGLVGTAQAGTPASQPDVEIDDASPDAALPHAAPAEQHLTLMPAQPKYELPAEIPQIKSPPTAIALSFGTTLAGYGIIAAGARSPGAVAVGGALALVGPTTGHIYAGDTWNAGLGYRIFGTGVAVMGLVLIDDGAGEGAKYVVETGGAIFLGGTIYEIATAGSAARSYNRKAARYRVVPIATPNTNGVSVVGSF